MADIFETFALLRKDFPILERRIGDGRRMVYLDSAATAHKPLRVLDAEREFYEQHNAAVHRGVHTLADEATDAYERARQRIGSFLNAEADEVVFTRNATEGINLLAYSMSNSGIAGIEAERFRIKPGDEVLVTEMEHHANLLPWQQLCLRTGARLNWVPVTENGRLDLSGLDDLLTERTRIVALTHQSNVTGAINPVSEIISRAHAVGALTVLDAAQSVPHMPVDVRALDVDFLAFSGHKMLGPSGIGVLWGRRELLETMPPFLTGGSMVETVFMDHSTFAPPPQRFEAGVPMTAQAVGLGVAVDYLSGIGMPTVYEHERLLTAYALDRIKALPYVHVIGPQTAEDRGATVSFTMDGVHPHDVGQVLDEQGVEVRVGHHCAWPLHRALGVPVTTRASFYIYNTLAEVDTLIDGLERVKRFFD
ncbi:cysteine desulfurase [Streptomyces sp. OE57]|uniref:cysteine desulfurase n=1 Tax=Streptomyces lacaronensis TaxID=3379885 RepID=UPI0039B7453B